VSWFERFQHDKRKKRYKNKLLHSRMIINNNEKCENYIILHFLVIKFSKDINYTIKKFDVVASTKVTP
jgi:hypothetical protein